MLYFRLKKLQTGSFLFLFILATLNAYGWLFQRRFEGDIASRMLLVLGPQLQLGSPYKDLWEIIPPGYIAVLQVWARVFGMATLHFVLLHYVFLSVCAPLIYFLLKKFFSGVLLYILVFFSAIVFYAPANQSMYISSELFGACFSLAALIVLFFEKNAYRKIGLSTALFIIAGQMKDPFLFGILAVGPFFLWELLIHNSLDRQKKIMLALLLGVLGPLVFFIVYLSSQHALQSYAQVLNYKTQFRTGLSLVGLVKKTYLAFGYVQQIFQTFAVPLPYLSFAVIFGFLSKPLMKSVKISKRKQAFFVLFKPTHIVLPTSFTLNERTIEYVSIVLFCLGSFIGMALQGSFSTHYLTQGVMPLFLILGLFCDGVARGVTSLFKLSQKSLFYSGVMLLISFSVLTPKPTFFKSHAQYWAGGGMAPLESPRTVVTYLQGLQTRELSDREQVEVLIKERVSSDECILHSYGWHVASTYIYTERKPCTRFFLANIVGQEWQKAEYRDSILQNLPAAVIYGVGGSNLNYPIFEQEVLNLPKILENCYHPDEKFVMYYKTFPATLYWPNGDKVQTKECVEKLLTSSL